MKTFLWSLLGSLLAIVLFVVLIGGGIFIKSQQKSKIEDHSWLVVDLYGDLLEYNPPTDLMGQVMGGTPETLTRILENLEKASLDDRIDGVLFKVAQNGSGFAAKEEIRGAIKKVQAAGKKVYGFSDSFSRRNYHTLAACDEIYSPPGAYIEFVGVALIAPFVKGALDKLGIKPNIHKIKDYKAAAELVTRIDMSAEVKENEHWLLEDFWKKYVADIEEDRGLSEAQIEAIMARASISAKTAVEVGLIDGVKYWDEIEDMLKGEEDELKTVDMARYAEVERKKVGLKGKKTIAVIHAQGNIGGRKSRMDPLMGMMMGHETVVADLRRAREDEDVAAIIFRVDSGGGESLASDLIGHEIARCAAEKPTICSMVNVAASGGYDIAYRANKILVLPGTVTGSIGSISGKFNMKGMFDKLGISHDSVDKGPNATMWSSTRDFTEKEWELFKEDHWAGFNRWLGDVAAIIFRVDSGGGESLASDLIGHELELCAAEKPTICSMVDVAASGGYDIAYRADKILVLPMTVTGSIGSISGKFNMKGFYDKLGISHDGISKGPNARMWSSLSDFSEEERQLFEEEHWESFNRWLTAIAEHRGMSFEEAETLAHGRVWTGRQAVANGLVDEIGGFDRAIELAKEMADIPAEDHVKLAHFPEEQDIISALTGGGDVSMAVNWIVYRWIHEDLAETWRLVSEHGMIENTVHAPR
jgi:protease-4